MPAKDVFHEAAKEALINDGCEITDNAVIVDRLMEKGIPQEDIVLGSLVPYKRQYSGFPAS